VIGREVALDRLCAAALAALDRLVDRALDHCRRGQLAHVAGEKGGHELTLAEDSRELAVPVHRRKRRQVRADYTVGGHADRVGHLEWLDLLDRGPDDRIWHPYLLRLCSEG
jgi:hypothetical protein